VSGPAATLAAVAIAAAAIAGSPGVTAPVTPALTEARRLAAVYDAILNAEFERAAAELRESCPPAPEAACSALAAISLWWQVLIDPESRALDEPLRRACADAIRTGTAWTHAEPRNAEAWFYLAGGYAPLVQLKVLRGERVSAARDGKSAKDALERTLALDPTIEDAHFGIGLYHYYADVAPAYAKLLRFLLLLPGGDRVKGLAEMQEARAHGELLTGEADFQLQQIYLWYEHRPGDALALLEALDARYPANPVFLQRIADAQTTYFHDVAASVNAWERLLDRARRDQIARAPLIAARAEQKLRDLRSPR